MLIRFSIENWMSFHKKASLSMIGTRERQHTERLPTVKKYDSLKMLPISAIYGGNASGKTNLVKALYFAKLLVIRGTQPDGPILVDPFLLDPKHPEMPAHFLFELLIDETIYEFSYTINRKSVLEEKLIKINSNHEIFLYHRNKNKIVIHSSIDSDFLKFAFQGTRDNQLFLTNSVFLNIDTFHPIYNWFKNVLEIVAPDSKFEPFDLFLQEGDPLYTKMNEILPHLDTGINRLGGEIVAFKDLPFIEMVKVKLQEEVSEGKTVRIRTQPNNEFFAITRKNGELIAKKLVTYHTDVNGNEVKFEIYQESDGTQRIIDLLPAFLEISSPRDPKVYVIDELDRSLHPLLIKKLIKYYLSACTANSRSQLLFTTHNDSIMDQKIFRRDEMWVTERNAKGESTLCSFSEYKDIRYDKDIRKSYLQGRLGGIPKIFLAEADRK